MNHSTPRWSVAAWLFALTGGIGGGVATLAGYPRFGAVVGLVGAGLALIVMARAMRARATPTQAESIPAAVPSASDSPARTLLDGVPSPVFGLDGRGVIVTCNRAAEAFIGPRPGGMIGRPLEDVFTQRDVLIQHAAALDGQTGKGEIRVPVGDATRRFEVVATPTPGDGRIAVVMTLRDVTELAEADQLKADFVANASHELRTPLASIRAAADTLAGGAWRDEAMRDRFIGMIATNAARLEEMVRDLLDLSRLESPEAPARLVEVSAFDLAAGLREMFEPAAAARRVRVEFVLDPALARLRTDPRLLHLVLKNLIENAVKFAYEGTTVRVEGEVGDAGPSGRRTARFRVMDRGVGIPIAVQGRIFERFFQADPARTGTALGRGTGLGLAIVKHAVKTLGGTIGVESVWKEGTTMTLTLPESVVEAA
ncbi:MAG: hypothetical protein HBSAPP03_10340 [Phycisphaerae bacterium]|nr:MAG: hypothetical protein HBSAPP03_10340 [Phycisphaerae bacterium]